jgi:hypothetical protein
MTESIASLGRWGLNGLEGAGRATIFLGRTLIRRPRVTKSFPLLIKEIYLSAWSWDYKVFIRWKNSAPRNN